MKAFLESTVFLLMLSAQLVVGEEAINIVVEATFADSELKEKLSPFIERYRGYVSIELVRKDGDYDPLLVPVVVSDDGTEFSAEIPGDRVQNRTMTYLVLTAGVISRYYLGELKGGGEVENFSFNFHQTTITYDFTRWREARDAATTTGRMLGGWIDLVGEKHAFYVSIRMDESLKGALAFLSLPTDKYEVNVKLYPRYSDVDTRTIEYDMPDPISFRQGESMEIIAK